MTAPLTHDTFVAESILCVSFHAETSAVIFILELKAEVTAAQIFYAKCLAKDATDRVAAGPNTDMQVSHRRCAQHALQYARLISHSHASTAATASVQESAVPPLESLRTRLAEGECLMLLCAGRVPQ